MGEWGDEGVTLTGEADAVVGEGIASRRSIAGLREDRHPLGVVGYPVCRKQARGAAWDRSGGSGRGAAMLGRQIAV